MLKNVDEVDEQTLSLCVCVLGYTKNKFCCQHVYLAMNKI